MHTPHPNNSTYVGRCSKLTVTETGRAFPVVPWLRFGRRSESAIPGPAAEEMLRAASHSQTNDALTVESVYCRCAMHLRGVCGGLASPGCASDGKWFTLPCQARALPPPAPAPGSPLKNLPELGAPSRPWQGGPPGFASEITSDRASQRVDECQKPLLGLRVFLVLRVRPLAHHLLDPVHGQLDLCGREGSVHRAVHGVGQASMHCPGARGMQARGLGRQRGGGAGGAPLWRSQSSSVSPANFVSPWPTPHPHHPTSSPSCTAPSPACSCVLAGASCAPHATGCAP